MHVIAIWKYAHVQIVNNYFQWWSIGRVKFYQKCVMNINTFSTELIKNLQPLTLNKTDALVSQKKANYLWFYCPLTVDFKKKNKKAFCYLYTLTVLHILYAVQDNSSSLNEAQASQKAGHPCVSQWYTGLKPHFTAALCVYWSLFDFAWIRAINTSGSPSPCPSGAFSIHFPAIIMARTWLCVSAGRQV